MSNELIITARLDASDVEKKAKSIENTLKGSKLNTPNLGQGLAKNMDAAKLSTDAMFRVIQSMGGPIGSIAGKFKGILEAARMMKPVLDQARTISNSTGGTNGNTLANIASNLGGGLTAGLTSRGVKMVDDRNIQQRIMKEMLGSGSGSSIAKLTTALSTAFDNAKTSIGKFVRAQDVSTKGLLKLGGAAALLTASWAAAINVAKASAAGTQAMSGAQDKIDISRRNRRYSDDSLPASERKRLMMTEIEDLNKQRQLVQGIGGSSQARGFMAGSTGITWQRLIPQFSGGARDVLKNADPKMVSSIREQFKASGKDPAFWANKTLEISDRFDTVAELISKLDTTTKTSLGGKISKGFFKGISSAAKFLTPQTDENKGKKTKLAPITDDLSRIGGSIGGGMDANRAMANDVNSIKNLVSDLKALMPRKSSGETAYI